MNELVNLVAQKTGLSPDVAQKAVNIVIDYLKKKLPAPIAGQIDGVLNNQGAMNTAQNLLGKLGSGPGNKK